MSTEEDESSSEDMFQEPAEVEVQEASENTSEENPSAATKLKAEENARILAKFDEIFKNPKADEKFARFLLDSREQKFTMLAKAVESLAISKDSDANKEKQALNIVKAVLSLTNSSMSTEGVEDLCGCLFTEIRHFKNKVLSDATTYCIDYIKSHHNDDISSRWIEIFGRIVSNLSSRSDIMYDGNDLDGNEFRTEVVRNLCRLDWGARNAPYLISAMKEFPGLESQDVNEIVGKASETIKKLDPASVPPIAYQLLLLGAERCPQKLLQDFDAYFKWLTFDQGSEQMMSNEIKAKRSALGTVVYHFIHAARHHGALVREIMKRIKNACDDHGLLMTPFILCVSLGLTSLEHLNTQVVEALRRAILNSLEDNHNSHLNAWYMSARGERIDSVFKCFQAVIDSKSSELDFMLDGLKDLGLVLLNVDKTTTGGHFSTDKCQELGSFIIRSLVKRKEYYFPKVMNELLKTKSLIHINCLASCIMSLTRKIPNSSLSGRISELIHHLPMMTVETATPIIKALLPTFHLSKSLLDEMIIVVRKTIWKSIEARKISVQAMVVLLSNSRVVGDIHWSQYSESQTVGSQQFDFPIYDLMNGAEKNEGLCSELLCILKRSFTQHREVRERLYIGLNIVSRKNPALIGSIGNNIVGQVRQHMDDSQTEIIMDKLLEFSSSGSMTISEELGLLLQCLSFVTLKGRTIHAEDSENQPPSLITCEATLDMWIKIMTEDISYPEIDSKASAIVRPLRNKESPPSSKCVRNALTLQILQTIEALMEYIALRGRPTDAETLDCLFKKYLEFKPHLETSEKKAKDKDNDKGASKKSKGTKASAKANQSTTSAKGSKKQNANKSKNTTIGSQTTQGGTKTKLAKPEPEQTFELVHIINFESILDILKDLYTVTVDDESVFSKVKAQYGFDKFLLGILKQKLDRLKKKEPLHERDRKPEKLFATLGSIAGVLWDASHKKALSDSATESAAANNMDTEDSDDITIVDSEPMLVDTFRFEVILDLVEFLSDQNEQTFSHKELLRLFTSEGNIHGSFREMFHNFFELWKEIVMKWTEGGRDKKGLEHLFVIVEVFCKAIEDPERSEITDLAESVFQWLLTYAQVGEGKCDTSSLEITGVVLQAILTVGSKVLGTEERFLILAQKCLDALGDVEDEESTRERGEDAYWLIDEKTAPTAIFCFGKCVKSNLNLVAAIIKRLKAQSLYFPIEELTTLRDKVCDRLLFLINLSTKLIQSNFPSGPCVDILQEVLPQVFVTTTLLTEYFIDIHTRNKDMDWRARKFQTLVKAIGKDFKTKVETLITHIETIQRTAADEEMKKGGKVAGAMKLKFMKDARTIPTLVYHMEKYEQMLVVLGQKIKINLLAGTKLSTARDYRIDTVKVVQAISKDANKNAKKKKRAREQSPESTDSDGEDSSSIQQGGLSRLGNTTRGTSGPSRLGNKSHGLSSKRPRS